MNKELFILFIGIIIGYFIFCNKKNNYKNKFENAIKTLLRQCSRWTVASLQDNNSMIAVLHANYGAAYLWALTDIISSCELEKITGINYIKFRNKITDAQDKATKKMANLCPKYAPKETYLSKLGGEN